MKFPKSGMCSIGQQGALPTLSIQSERWRRNAKNQRTHTDTVTPVRSDEIVKNLSNMYVMITLAFIAHVAVAHAWTAWLILIKTPLQMNMVLCSSISSVINKVSVPSDTTLPLLTQTTAHRYTNIHTFSTPCDSGHERAGNAKDHLTIESDHSFHSLLYTAICLVVDHQFHAHRHALRES